MVLELVANQSVGNDLEVRILHTAFADEWNGIPRKSHDLEIVGSTPASAISELRGSQINIFFGLPTLNQNIKTAICYHSSNG